MFSYIFMKILESRPERYDGGIGILSAGHADKTRNFIVDTYVKKNMKMLDVGCGTGSLAVKAAEAGAGVTGIDISEGMLSVARKKIDRSSLQKKVRLQQAGVMEMDSLFPDDCFDLVTSTLVVSELYPAERRWCYAQMRRVLKPEGILIIAGEVLPKNFMKRILYRLVRFPLAVLTCLVAQTGTKAVVDFGGELIDAGFHIISEDYSFLDSFVVITARKNRGRKTPEKKMKGMRPGEDFSPLKTVWDFAGRWFPNPVKPGLRVIGDPGRDAPVFVTANLHLTVRRVERSLGGIPCYLLVAPTGGINTWCGAAGGEMTEHSVISVVKSSGIRGMVNHKKLVLPLFSASGIERDAVKKTTGFNVIFGPAYSEDIPEFIKKGKLTADNSRARFPLFFRLEMLLSMNILLWAVVLGIIFLSGSVSHMLFFSLVFWGTGGILYTAYPLIPGKSGWVKSIIVCIVVLATLLVTGRLSAGSKLACPSEWIIAEILIALWLGFDLRGIVSGGTSEAVILLDKLNVRSFGKLHKSSGRETKTVSFYPEKCTLCKTCIGVCPVNVFELKDKTVSFTCNARCMKCGACVKQCPAGALKFTG